MLGGDVMCKLYVRIYVLLRRRINSVFNRPVDAWWELTSRMIYSMINLMLYKRGTIVGKWLYTLPLCMQLIYYVPVKGEQNGHIPSRH